MLGTAKTLILIFIFINAVYSAGGCQGAGDLRVCVDGFVEKQNVILTIHTTYTGWASIGFGASMTDAKMIIGWKNSTNGYIVSDRMSTAQRAPLSSPIQTSQVIPLQGTSPSWAKMSFSITRPLKTNELTIGPLTVLIAAGSNAIPTNIDSQETVLQKHRDAGLIGAIDFTKSTGPTDIQEPKIPPTSTKSEPSDFTPTAVAKNTSILTLPKGTDYTLILQIHGFIMIFAWILCPFIGIFIARYLKSLSYWFYMHLLVMILGCGCSSFAGIGFIYLYKSSSHFNDLHGMVGLGVVVLMVLQVCLGFFIGHLFDENRGEIPMRDIVHWWVGRIVFVAALVDIFLGLQKWEDFSDSALLAVVAGGLLLVAIIGFLLGEYKMGKTGNHLVKFQEQTKPEEEETYDYDSYMKQAIYS